MSSPSPSEEQRTWWCLTESQLSGYLDGVLSGWTRRRAERHLVRCKRCRRELSLLLHSERAPYESPPPEWLARVGHLGEKPAPLRKSGWQWATAAAGLACLLSLAAWLAVHQPTPLREAKNTTPMPVQAAPAASADGSELRSLAPHQLEPVVISPDVGTSVPRDVEIRWQPVGGAVSYELALLNANGNAVWHARTRDDHLSVPALVPVKSGAEYFVMVTANLSSGKTVRAKAVPFRFEEK